MRTKKWRSWGDCAWYTMGTTYGG